MKERWIFRGYGVFGIVKGEIITKTPEGQYEKEDKFRIPPEIFERIPEWFEKIEEDQKPEKPKEIFLWGVCNNDGRSHLFEGEPEKSNIRLGEWFYMGMAYMMKLPNNLFPKDKPVKFKLTPVEEQ